MNERSISWWKIWLRLWGHFSKRRKFQLVMLVALMVITSVAEILNIGSVMPFISSLVAPETVLNNQYLQPLLRKYSIDEPTKLIIPAAFVCISAIVITNLLRTALLWGSTKLSSAIGFDLSLAAFKNVLHQPYLNHIARNSSQISADIGKVSAIVLIVNTIFTFVGSLVILIPVLFAIFWINPLMAFIFFGGIGSIYLLIVLVTRRALLESGRIFADESTKSGKVIHEGLGAIRDILIDGAQAVYCEEFYKASLKSIRARDRIQFIGGSPRYFMEMLGMCLIILSALYLVFQVQGTGSSALPLLAALGFAAQRLLPVIQNLYSAWSGLQGIKASLIDALNLLDTPVVSQKIGTNDSGLLPFETGLNFQDVGFQYSIDGKWVLNNLNLNIGRGSRLGIIGKTGSGKSTLLDLMMGLILPTKGRIEVDHTELTEVNVRGWQKRIAHVPQSIYLTDNSIAENIAFGVPMDSIDHHRMRKAAQMARIDGLVETLPRKYNTSVGERGVMLSGGQRQRIGIARAFYKGADILIFDEATSALDGQTESDVMQSINDLGDSITVIVVAHRMTTLKNCTQIVEIKDGLISRVGTYGELCEN